MSSPSRWRPSGAAGGLAVASPLDYCLEDLEQLVDTSPTLAAVARFTGEHGPRQRLQAIAHLLAATRKRERLLLQLLEATDG